MLDLELEQTYTGKAMEALLADVRNGDVGDRGVLYWHTYNSVPLNVPTDAPLVPDALPVEFMRYFD